MDVITHQAGMKAARLTAEWHLGDRAWGDQIVWAYLNPEAAVREIQYERDEARDDMG